MGRIFLRMLVGGAAGLLVWAIMEPSAPKQFADPRWGTWSLTFVTFIGAMIGLAVGGLDGYFQGTSVRTWRGLILGLVFGTIGGAFGNGLGSAVVEAVFGRTVFLTGNFPSQVMARTVAFLPIGLALGFAIGASSLNIKKAIQGMVGGGIGAGIAGALFDPVSAVFGQALMNLRGGDEVGIAGRIILSVVQGALIGLFIGIVERVTRSAWVRLTLGRNEGKEWVMNSSQNYLGRSERAHVPLFGDPNIIELHACIVRQGPNQYLLADGGSQIGTYLNGQRISQAPLFHGAVITIGSYNLEFLMKNQAAPARGPEAYPGQAYPIGGQQVSPYPRQGYAAGPADPQPAPQPMPQQQPMQQAPMNQTVAVTPAPASFTLTALDGPLAGQRFPIAGPTDLGREMPAIPLSFDSQTSRRHASVKPDTMGLAVTDLGSTNGTFVNGQRVQSQTLRSGDLLKIGATTFRVD